MAWKPDTRLIDKKIISTLHPPVGKNNIVIPYSGAKAWGFLETVSLAAIAMIIYESEM